MLSFKNDKKTTTKDFLYENGKNISLNTEIFYDSVKGLRETNEDTHVIYETKNLKIYGIFDGHGGNEVSNFLKCNIPLFLKHKKIIFPLNKKQITEIFSNIQKYISEQPYGLTTGSTCCIILIHSYNNVHTLYCINVGDSRAILFTKNKILPLSIDHKPTNPTEIKRIMKMGGKIRRDGSEYRINGLSLSRAFGDASSPETFPEPDITSKILTDDCFFVIGCDGLYDVMTNNDIYYEVYTFIHKTYKSNIAKELTTKALKNGSHDNVTVIVGFLQLK